MADNVLVKNGTGAGTDFTAATDEKTINAVAVQVQRMNLALGKDGSYVGDTSGRLVDGDANASALFVDPRPKAVRLAVTPTISTTQYTAKDAVGGLMTFANAVRASGGSCLIQSMQIEDKGQQLKDLDLVLFDRSITAPTDNAIFAPTDTELSQCVGVISTGVWSDFSTNSVAVVNTVGLEVVLNGTDLFGVLVSRSATGPTYTSTTDLVVTLTILQD